MYPSKQVRRLWMSQFRSQLLEACNRASAILAIEDVREVLQGVVEDVDSDMEDEHHA